MPSIKQKYTVDVEGSMVVELENLKSAESQTAMLLVDKEVSVEKNEAMKENFLANEEDKEKKEVSTPGMHDKPTVELAGSIVGYQKK